MYVCINTHTYMCVCVCVCVFFFIMVSHRMLNIVPCRILLFIHLIYHTLPLWIPNSQSIPSQPTLTLATTRLFSMSVSLFWFHRYVDLYHILESTCKWYHMISYLPFCFWLTLLSVIISSSIHVAAYGIISSFWWLSNIPLYICTTSSSLTIRLLMDV